MKEIEKLTPEILSESIAIVKKTSLMKDGDWIPISYCQIELGDKSSLNTFRTWMNLDPLDPDTIKDIHSAWNVTLNEAGKKLIDWKPSINQHHLNNYGCIVIGDIEILLSPENKIKIVYYLDPKKEKFDQPQKGDIILEKIDADSYMVERLGEGALGIFLTEEDALQHIEENVEDPRENIVVFIREKGIYSPIFDLTRDDKDIDDCQS